MLYRYEIGDIRISLKDTKIEIKCIIFIFIIYIVFVISTSILIDTRCNRVEKITVKSEEYTEKGV